jgi:hypothetical protein
MPLPPSRPRRQSNNHPPHIRPLILQWGPMRRQPLTPPIHHALLRHQIYIRRDGPPRPQRGLDAALEVARHVGRVLQQHLEDVEPDQREVVFGVEAEEVDQAGGEELDEEGVEGEDEELEGRIRVRVSVDGCFGGG